MKRRHPTSLLSATHALAPVLAAVLLAALPGCGGGSGKGNGNADGGGGSPPGSGAFTWKDGATMHTAAFSSGARVTSTGLDTVQITGSDSGAAVSFAVSLMSPPLVAGAYACSDNGLGTGRIVSITYVVGSLSGLAPACAIALTSIGASTGTHATGTFSATVPMSDGTTRTLTDGVYDVMLTVSSI